MSSLMATVRSRRPVFVSSILCWSLLAYGQYPGRIDAKKEKPPVLRSIAVLEWVGEPGKPSASRIVPVSVFDGKTYQDGGIYMARPAPLAVEADTEYQLLQTGVPQGNFDVFSSEELGGFWYGYGVWKPVHEAAPPKLVKSKISPQIVSDVDPQRPHFKTGGSDSGAGSSTKSDPGNESGSKSAGNGDASKSSVDDDKPTLKKRSADSTTSPGSGSTQAPPPGDSSTDSSHSSKNNSAADDPDRPRLRKRSDKSGQAEPGTPQEAASAVSGGDPDRPKLRRGQPAASVAAGQLTGTPPNLQQMIAVSDATYREPHPYAYEWANPDDAKKMQAAMEQIARNTLSAKAPPGNDLSQPAAGRKTSKLPLASRSPARAVAGKQPAKSAGPQLVEVDFKAFELAYSGGSTLVFSARTIDDGTPIRYITLLAQPDFYGVPQVIFKQVTDASHLDVTPRLKLIDAVDTDGDNRAELIFEQRNKSDRQFAIYSVKSNRVEQVFATGPIPVNGSSPPVS